MLINQRINIRFCDEDSRRMVEHNSLLCNKMYNLLLEEAIRDYENGSPKKLMEGYNLRDEVVVIKQKNPYFYSVHSSPLKNTGLRLRQAYKNFFNGSGHPKFRSNRVRWFSLYYDEPNKGIKIEGRSIQITLGETYDENNKKKRNYAYAVLEEGIKRGNIRNFRIIKSRNRYYLVVCLEVGDREEREGERRIALDPNHKNFFVGVDSSGRSVEFENLYQIQYFDREIDRLKSKRDRCRRKSVKGVNAYGTEYWKPSRMYARRSRALERLYEKREIQIKDAMYRIAHTLCDSYDVIAIGDYTPTAETAPEKKMHRKVLNQTPIGKFREILKHVCTKRGKKYILVNEKNTTKKCHSCGHSKKKTPDVRNYTCPKCGRTYNRDINSAINIGIKGKILSSSDYIDSDLSGPMYTVRYMLHKQCVSAGIK